MIWLAYWKEMALGLALCACGVFFSLWRHEVSANAEYRAEVAQIAKAQFERTKIIEDQQKRITDETANAWAANLNAVRAYYARRMHYAGSGQVPVVPGTPGGPDAIPEDALPIAADCGETTVQLIELQDWIRKQKAVK